MRRQTLALTEAVLSMQLIVYREDDFRDSSTKRLRLFAVHGLECQLEIPTV